MLWRRFVQSVISKQSRQKNATLLQFPQFQVKVFLSLTFTKSISKQITVSLNVCEYICMDRIKHVTCVMNVSLELNHFVNSQQSNEQQEISDMWLDQVHNEFWALDQSHLTPPCNLAVEDWRVIWIEGERPGEKGRERGTILSAVLPLYVDNFCSKMSRADPVQVSAVGSDGDHLLLDNSLWPACRTRSLYNIQLKHIVMLWSNRVKSFWALWN